MERGDIRIPVEAGVLHETPESVTVPPRRFPRHGRRPSAR